MKSQFWYVTQFSMNSITMDRNVKNYRTDQT